MVYSWPSDEQWAYIQSQINSEGTVTMLNLLKYRETADYSDHPEENPCSGREAYERYRQHAAPLVEAYGGLLLFAGTGLPTIIGPADQMWDEILLVEYPSIEVFVEMTSSEKYQTFAYHRTAAIEDSRLIPART